MIENQNELKIRSRYGLFRDLIPIYSTYQIIPNLAVYGTLLWLSRWVDHFLTLALIIAMLFWVFQFVLRPSIMTISKEQAAWLQATLNIQGSYNRSESDGRWRLTGRSKWKSWPHDYIEFIADDNVTLIAPRDMMEAIRNNLEALPENNKLLFSNEARPFTFNTTEPEPLSWQMHVPATVIGGACVFAFFWQNIFSSAGEIGEWGISSAALFQGRFETIFVHMLAHGSTMHLTMNVSTLAVIGGTMTARLGMVPLSWFRFLILFLLSGFSGAALYLIVHPTGTVPMLGASGALYGLIGLLIRIPNNNEPLLATSSSQVRRIGWSLIKQNVFIFVLLALISLANGTAGALAWEAHLGGFLFGLFIGPKLLPYLQSPRLPAGR